MYNPTNEQTTLKSILTKIEDKKEVITDFIDVSTIEYLKKNIESIKIYKSKNKNNYKIHDVCDYSEIAFIKKTY